MDTVSKDVRSRNMAAIRSKNTKPEMILRSFLHKKGLRFRVHKVSLPGKPDLYLQKHETAIFVHGCFWHQHAKCKIAVLPKSHRNFWIPKLKGNILRGKKNIQELRAMGLNVVVVWECQIWDKNRGCIKEEFLNNLLSKIEGCKKR